MSTINNKNNKDKNMLKNDNLDMSKVKNIEIVKYKNIDVEINEDYKKAFDAIDNNSNIFITGEAGTGKSMFLKLLCNKLKEQHKHYVVLAPTGVAALNVNGCTIHSFFKFGIHNIRPYILEKKKELFKNLKVVIIDEVSMLRADLLDYIDEALQLNKGSSLPFGGCQVIFIGDLSQLPPVTMDAEKILFSVIYNSPYFLSARVINDAKLKMIKFTKIYRQKGDSTFIEMLNQIRCGRVSYDTLNKLNSKVGYNHNKDKNNILITTTNKAVQNYNSKMLNILQGEAKHYKAVCEGIKNEDLVKYGVESEIILKNDAKIMFLNNDYENGWVNGSLGKVKDMYDNQIVAELDNGNTVKVNRIEIDINDYKWDDKDKEVIVEKQATIQQLPIKLAYASTIHKVQGMTFDKINLDLGWGAFAPGQLYVALSRATSLNGITLIRPIKPKDIILDGRIDNLISECCEIL